MVKGFKIKSKDLCTIRQINIALSKLPADMTFESISINPLDVNIVPATDKVKLAMYKDKLEGKKGEKIKQDYLNIIMPFFRQYVKNVKKMEIQVYD